MASSKSAPRGTQFCSFISTILIHTASGRQPSRTALRILQKPCGLFPKTSNCEDGGREEGPRSMLGREGCDPRRPRGDAACACTKCPRSLRLSVTRSRPLRPMHIQSWRSCTHQYRCPPSQPGLQPYVLVAITSRCELLLSNTICRYVIPPGTRLHK